LMSMPRAVSGSSWTFPSPSAATPEGVVGIGADLEPETLLDAYVRGIFPMPVRADEGPGHEVLGWWSPDPRGVLPPRGFEVSRSLRRSARRFRTTINEAFADVVSGCADPARPHGWITEGMAEAYARLYRRGLAHSVEVWNGDGELVGGLYGVSVGGLFAAESKFYRETDASKVAVARLVEELLAGTGDSEPLLDVQWCTPHLASLGAIEISRVDYLRRLEQVVCEPQPVAFTRDATRLSSPPQAR
jgi:leucyl/phenylalanyl-tRNA--protein transferase